MKNVVIGWVLSSSPTNELCPPRGTGILFIFWQRAVFGKCARVGFQTFRVDEPPCQTGIVAELWSVSGNSIVGVPALAGFVQFALQFRAA
jgi:hypothetical protein